MNARDPESVANGVLFRVLRTLHRIERLDGATFQAILYRALKNEIIDEHRASAIRPVTLPLYADLNDGPGERALEDDRAFAAIEDREYVERLLDSLKAEQRDVLRYRFLQDLSVEETANLLGRSSNATRQLQHRALSALRAVIVATVAVLVIVLSSMGGNSIETIAPASGPSAGVGEDRSAFAPDVGGEQDRAVAPAPSAESGVAVPIGPVRIRHVETGRYLMASSASEVSLVVSDETEPEWTVSGSEGSYSIVSRRFAGLRLADSVVAIKFYAEEAGSADMLSPLGGFVIRSASSGWYLTAGSNEPVMTSEADRSARWAIEAASVGDSDGEQSLVDPTNGVVSAGGRCEVDGDGSCRVQRMPDVPAATLPPFFEPAAAPSPPTGNDLDNGTEINAGNITASEDAHTDAAIDDAATETGTGADAGDRPTTLPVPSEPASPSGGPPSETSPVDFAAPQPPTSEPVDVSPVPPQVFTTIPSALSLQFGTTGLCAEVAPTGADGVAGTDGVDGADGVDGVAGTDGLDGANGVAGTDGVYSATADRSTVVLAFCTGHDNQAFVVEDVGDDQVELLTLYTGRCLQVAGASFEPDVEIVEGPCGEAASRWYLFEGEATTADGELVEGSMVVSALSGLCLDVGSDPVEGVEPIQMPCDGRTTQLLVS